MPRLDELVTAPQTARSDLQRYAEGLVLEDFVNSLFYENLFGILERSVVDTEPSEPVGVPGFDLEPGELYFRLDLPSNGRTLLFRVRHQPFLQPYRLTRPPVLIGEHGARTHRWRAASPVEVLSALAADHLIANGADSLPNLDGCLADLDAAVSKTADCLLGDRFPDGLDDRLSPGGKRWLRMISQRQRAITRNRAIAEEAAKERLLNAYLRERGVPDPRLSPDGLAAAGIPPEVADQIRSEDMPFRLSFPTTGKFLVGTLTYFSPGGHHQYGNQLWVSSAMDLSYSLVDSALDLANLLIGEVAALDPNTGVNDGRQHSLLKHIENSIEKTARYVGRSLPGGRSQLRLGSEDCFLAGEQRLIVGHPFHPTPKSTEGFSHADLERYAPELGASFQLHYFAVHPEVVDEGFLPEAGDRVIPASARLGARVRLGAGKRDWPLIPCHPWQAGFLRELPEVDQLIAAGQFVDLGPMGNPVFPTSSVRTVWDPQHAYFLKLPLAVRITNFVRINPPEHLRRSLDVSRAVTALWPEVPFGNFTVLREVGYRSITLPDLPEEHRDWISGCAGVLFREAHRPAGSASPIVLAALLEPSPFGEEPPIMEAIRLAAEARNHPISSSLVAEWLRRYLEISLIPLCWLFVQGGISLEAHAQNSLVSLRAGWPETFTVRDLEGASISRERAVTRRLFDGQLNEGSPAFYPDTEAWQRFKYYFLVNHLGHLIFTLARYTPSDERQLWQVARDVLQEQASLFRSGGGECYLEDLLDSPNLPAKANLLSRFQERGESPLYIPVPNPISRREVSA